MKFSKRLAVALGAVSLAVVGLSAPAQAAPSPATIYIGGPSGSISTCTSAGSIGVYSDSAHTTAVTTITGTSGSLSFHNDCSNYAIYASFPTNSTSSVPGTAFSNGAYSISTLYPSVSGTMYIYQCAYVAQQPGTSGGCTSPGDRNLATTLTISFPSATILNTANGTVTVTYSALTGTPSLSLCATSVAVNLCDATTALYVFDSNIGTGLAASPAVIASGSAANTGGTYSATTVADGTYRFVLRDGGNSFAIVATQSAGVIGAGGGSGGSSSAADAPTETLSLAVSASGATCTGGNPSGVSGSWLTLPSADQCSQSGPTAKAGATLLGWSTSANFPIARAQSQIDKHWGVIDEEIAGIRMIFIPAGMAVFVSGSNNLYPIWSK